MIGAALLLLLQVGDTLTSITVRNGATSATVPIMFTRTGPMVSASAVAMPLGMSLHAEPNGRWSLTAGLITVELTPGAPFARVGTDAQPLSAAPVARGGELYLPLSLFTDVFPRTIAGMAWDRGRAELRRFRPETAAPSAATSRGAAVPARVDDRRVLLKPRGPHVVVVDAGHGGPDRGMRGPIVGNNPIAEAEITLQVAQRLRNVLLSKGAKVVMTRDRDTLIALADRGRIANRAQGTLFLSIHVNAANRRWRNPAGARGFETYFLAEAKTEDERRVEEMENEAVKYDVASNSETGDPLAFLLSDMQQNEHLRESSDLAVAIQQGIGAVHPAPGRGVKQAGFRVLVSAFMPAVLIEIGFGSNRDEARWMSGAAGQQRLAEAIADATLRYLGDYDRRLSAGGARP